MTTYKCPWCPSMLKLGEEFERHARTFHGAKFKAEPNTQPVPWAKPKPIRKPKSTEPGLFDD